MPSVHGMFFHYSELPLSRRALFKGDMLVLGIGYKFATLHIYNSHADRDGDPKSSCRDIVIAWVCNWAGREKFKADVKPFLDAQCVTCHDGSNPHVPNFNSFEHLSRYAELDTGTDIHTLVWVSHIHLFGLTLVFFHHGPDFRSRICQTDLVQGVRSRHTLRGNHHSLASWYVKKLCSPFALVVVIIGGFMGAAFAAIWIISIHQIWFYRFSREEEIGHGASVL